MGLRNVPTSIKDPNLAGFLRELRAAVGGVSEQVTRLVQTRSTSGGGGGGGGGGDGGGGTDPGGGGGGTTPPVASTIILTIAPSKPLSEEDFTLTATVTGDQPTGTVQFRQDGNLMTIDPVSLSAGKASVTDQRDKGIYTFVAEYSGDTRNLSAVSNVLTVEIGSMWDGPPAALTSLTAESGINFITLKWTLPYTGDLDVVEIWMATTSTLTLDAEGEPTNATKIGESNGSLLVYVPPEMGTTYYFWGRVRDAELLYSDFYPALNAGVPGAAVSLEDEIANSPLWEDLGTRLTDGEAAIEEISGIVEGPNGLAAQYMVKTDVDGLVSGFGLYNDGEVSDFFVRADRFAVGNPASYRGGTCSIAGHTTASACKAAGGTWTWTNANATNIPFIVYTTAQTITAPDGSGRTLTIQPGVYMKTANIQKAFVGDAEIYGDLKSYSWSASGGPTTFPFNGWKLDKASNLALYGGSFALYDEYGNPIIQAGKIAFSSFRRLIVLASAELFTIAKPPSTAITPSTITLNAVLQNISGTVTWSVTSGTYGAALGTGVQKTIDPAQMTTATVTFKASTTVDSVVYEDYVTLAKVQDGSDSLWLYLSNEAHLVPADAAGAVSSYAGASTIAKVYRGATDVTTSESWAISAASFTGLSGAPDVSGNTVGFADGSPSMTADMATITVRASKSGQPNLDRVFTVAKAKQGSTGSSAYSMILSNESHTIPAAANGSVISYSGAVCTATIYLGASPDTGWTFAGSPASSSNLTYTTSGGTFTVTGMAAGVDSAFIDITASKSGQTSIVRRFSISKAKNGQTLSLSTTAQVIKGNSGVAGANTPPQFTITATTTGSVSNLNWEFSNSQTATPAWNTVGALGSSWTLGSSSGDGGSYFPQENSIFRVRVTDTVTGISDTITISRVVDGASGSRGSGIYSGTVANSSWPADATANAFVPNGVPVIFDLLTLTFNSGEGPVESRRWNGSAWQTAQNSLSGGLFVDGGIVADKLGAGSITSAVITLAGSGGVIRSSTFTLGNPGAGIPPQGFRISGDGNAFFYGSAVAGSARSTNWNGTINGTTGQPTAGTGTQGWCIDTAGNAEFNTVIVRRRSNLSSGVINKMMRFEYYPSVTPGTWWTTLTDTQSDFYPIAAVGTICNFHISVSMQCALVLSGFRVRVDVSEGNITKTFYDDVYNNDSGKADQRHISGTTSIIYAVPSWAFFRIFVEAKYQPGGTQPINNVAITVIEGPP